MKRTLTIFGLLLMLLIPSALAADVNVTLDGQPLENFTATMVDNTAYVSFRDFCEQVGKMDVTRTDRGIALAWNADFFVEATPAWDYIAANGRCFYLGDTPVIMSDTLTMVPAQVIARAYDAAVSWNAETNTLEITSGSGIPVSGAEYYNADDLYWLARIIQAESGNQPLEGKIAVGTVILNRVASPQFPNTIYDVIFDRRCSVQFTPTANGSIYNTPSADSVLAAKLCLDGAREAENSLYFVTSRSASRSWAGRNRPYVETIGAHNFYA